MKRDETYYDILGITPTVPQEIITVVYRAWMMTLKVHPDLGGDEDLAKRVNEAYEVLKDPERRYEYDVLLKRRLGPQGLSPEKRRAPRTTVVTPIAYCVLPESEWQKAETIDACIMGLGLHTSSELVVGSHVAIAFPGRTENAVEAIVRWSNVKGERWIGGIMFTAPVPDILFRLGLR